MASHSEKRDLIGIVGPCSAGKSTLIGKLHKKGFHCRHIAQEHSFVPNMWQKVINPIVLVYLDVSYDVSMRRKKINMNAQEFDEQLARLNHARQYADIYLHTDPFTPEEVVEAILISLEERGFQPSR